MTLSLLKSVSVALLLLLRPSLDMGTANDKSQ